MSQADFAALAMVRLFSYRDNVKKGCTDLMRLDETIRRQLFEILRTFLVSPWWARIWVVQEVTVNKAVIIHYGATSASWDVFEAVASTLSFLKHNFSQIQVKLESENVKVILMLETQLSNIEKTRKRWQTEGGVRLLHLLQEFSSRKAGDDRDKIYALLSLARSGHCVVPDYSLDILQTFRSTILSLTKSEGSLDAWAGDQRRKNNKGLPSWIPDWSTTFDQSDTRRMDALHIHDVSRGWNLRIIDTAVEYLDTVVKSTARLVEWLQSSSYSRALSESLRPSISRCIRDILQIHARKYFFFAQYDIQPPLILNLFRIYRQLGVDIHPEIDNLIQALEHHTKYSSSWSAWATKNRTDYPFPINLQKTLQSLSSELLDQSFVDINQEKVKELITCIADIGAVYHEAKQKEQRLYESTLYHYEAKDTWWCEDGPKLIIGEFLIDLVRQLELLASYCTAVDGGIHSAELFSCSYSFIGSSFGFLRLQRDWNYPQIRPNPLVSSWIGSPASLITLYSPTLSDRVFPIQTIALDSIHEVGPRLLGWSDRESAFRTLFDWFCLLFRAPAITFDNIRTEVSTKSRLTCFARTIIAGVCGYEAIHRLVRLEELQPLLAWLSSMVDAFTKYTGYHISQNTPEKQSRIEIMDILSIFGISLQDTSERFMIHIPFEEDIKLATEGRVFFVTKNGLMGLGPASTEPEHTVHVFPSGKTHFILNENTPQHRYSLGLGFKSCELIGDCYLDTGNWLSEQLGIHREHLELPESLPYELLGPYIDDNVLKKRRNIMLI